MAAKRVAASAIDWAAFAARIPEGQKVMFNAFKGKSDSLLRKVLTRPETLPAIDFASYSRIPVAGMVADFQKQYEAVAIPYPADVVSSQIDDAEKAAAVEVQDFIKGSQGRIVALSTELAGWEAMIPYDQMTMEEWAEAFPDQAITPDNPTMWPHNPEEQIGYVAKEGVEAH